MSLPKIKRDLHNFIKDEKGTMTKKNILKAGIAFGTLVGLSQNVFAGHDNHTDHNNNLAMNYADPDAVGTHTHHTQHTNISWPDRGGGWIFDCFGIKDNPGLNNHGELLTFFAQNSIVKGNKNSFWLTLYYLFGILLKIKKINGIPSKSYVAFCREIIKPKHNLSDAANLIHYPLIRACAMHGLDSLEYTLHELAKKGIISIVLEKYLSELKIGNGQDTFGMSINQKTIEGHIKRINCLIEALENSGQDVQQFINHPSYKLLSRIAQSNNLQVCTKAEHYLGIILSSVKSPSRQTLSKKELMLYYGLWLTPFPMLIRIGHWQSARKIFSKWLHFYDGNTARSLLEHFSHANPVGSSKI